MIHLIIRIGGAPPGPFYHQWIKSIIINGKYLNLSPISGPHPTHHSTILHDSIPIRNETIIEITFCSNEESIDPGKQFDNEVRVKKLSMTNPFGLSKINLGEKIWYGPTNKQFCLPITSCHFSAPRTIVLIMPKLKTNTTYAIYTNHLGDVAGVPQFARGEIKNTIVTNRSCFRNPDHWTFQTTSVEKVQTESLLSDYHCVICLENTKNIVLLPCKHMCLCIGCSIKYMNQQGEHKCPLCKKNIESTMQIFA